MIPNKTFHRGLLRKYVVLFGTLFNDIWINREDENGKIINTSKVPIQYSPKEKLLARIATKFDGFDTDERPFSIVLPQMGFEITGFEYDPERKQNTIRKFHRKDMDNPVDQRRYQYNPVPYNITFDLSVFVKNTSDGTKIIEQILPFFTPEWVSTVILDDDLIPMDVPLVIQSISQEDVYEGSFEERRSLIWTLSFIMKVWFFGPKHKQGVIHLANTNISDATLFTDIDDAIGVAPTTSRITTTPGLTANGEPTTDPLLTVPAAQIKSNDNFDYIQTTVIHPDE